MEAATTANAKPKPAEPAEPGEPGAGADLIAKAAKPNTQLTAAEAMSATDWLLSDDPAVAPKPTRTLEVNVGSDEAPLVMEWTVTSITAEQYRYAQERATPAAARRTGDTTPDPFEMGLWVVVAGSINPDINDAAKKKGAPNPARFLAERFVLKPFLVTQISGVILGLSGSDDANVREVAATKNS